MLNENRIYNEALRLFSLSIELERLPACFMKGCSLMTAVAKSYQGFCYLWLLAVVVMGSSQDTFMLS